MISVHHQFHSSLIPSQTSRTSSSVPCVPLFASWPFPRDCFIYDAPTLWNYTSLGKLFSASVCLPLRWLFIPGFIPIFVCFKLFCLVMFRFSMLTVALSSFYHLFFFILFLDIHLIYFRSILGLAWLRAECYKKADDTADTCSSDAEYVDGCRAWISPRPQEIIEGTTFLEFSIAIRSFLYLIWTA